MADKQVDGVKKIKNKEESKKIVLDSIEEEIQTRKKHRHEDKSFSKKVDGIFGVFKKDKKEVVKNKKNVPKEKELKNESDEEKIHNKKGSVASKKNLESGIAKVDGLQKGAKKKYSKNVASTKARQEKKVEEEEIKIDPKKQNEWKKEIEGVLSGGEAEVSKNRESESEEKENTKEIKKKNPFYKSFFEKIKKAKEEKTLKKKKKKELRAKEKEEKMRLEFEHEQKEKAEKIHKQKVKIQEKETDIKKLNEKEEAEKQKEDELKNSLKKKEEVEKEKVKEFEEKKREKDERLQKQESQKQKRLMEEAEKQKIRAEKEEIKDLKKEEKKKQEEEKIKTEQQKVKESKKQIEAEKMEKEKQEEAEEKARKLKMQEKKELRIQKKKQKQEDKDARKKMKILRRQEKKEIKKRLKEKKRQEKIKTKETKILEKIERKKRAEKEQKEKKRKIARLKEERGELLEKRKKDDEKTRKREEKLKKGFALKKKRERQKRREETFENLNKLVKNLSRTGRDKFLYIAGKIINIFLVAFVLFVFLYALFAFSLLKINTDNALTRKIADYIFVPSFISSDGAIDYYQYTDYLNRIAKKTIEGKYDLNTRARLNFTKEFIYSNILKSYNLEMMNYESIGSEEAEELNKKILTDIHINQVAISRIKKIKEMIEESGNFVKISSKYGDKTGSIIVNEKNRHKFTYLKSVEDLQAGDVSNLIVDNGGYYIFRVFETDKNYMELNFVFVNGVTLEDYISAKVDGYKLWSFVD